MSGEILYVIRDTTDPDLREVASYTAAAIEFLPNTTVAVFTDADNTLVAMHYLAPGQAITPEFTEVDTED